MHLQLRTSGNVLLLLPLLVVLVVGCMVLRVPPLLHQMQVVQRPQICIHVTCPVSNK
jgi:hypothetical protein